MSCAPIFLAFLVTSTLAEQPLVQLIEEAIYENNQQLLKNHQEEQKIQAFSLDLSYLQLNSGGGKIGNFSTVGLVGTPVCTQETRTDGTSYDFDLTVGLGNFIAELDYDVSLFIFLSTSGTVSFTSTGNAVRGKFMVNTYNGNVPCHADLEVVEVKSLGSMDLKLGQSGIFKWMLSKFLNLFITLSKPFIRSFVNQRIDELVRTPEFLSKFGEMACKPFDFNI